MSGSEALFGIFPGLPTPPPSTPVIYAKGAELTPKRPEPQRWVSRPIEPGPGRPRKYPPALIGDVHGIWRVVALLARDAASNERVRVSCPNGHERDVRAFNLRKAKQRCPGCKR